MLKLDIRIMSGIVVNRLPKAVGIGHQKWLESLA